MCALNCLAWCLQDSLVLVPVVAANDKYTAMIHGLVYLSECVHEETATIQGVHGLKSADERTPRLWMLNKADSLELGEEQALASIVAYMNCFDGSLLHHFLLILPPERSFFHVMCHQAFVVWIHDERWLMWLLTIWG
jgi:hypothetical protein